MDLKSPPVTGVSYFRAKTHLKRMGKRLCTSLEWEKTCRGSESLIFSYGDSFDATKCTWMAPINSEKIQIVKMQMVSMV